MGAKGRGRGRYSTCADRPRAVEARESSKPLTLIALLKLSEARLRSFCRQSVAIRLPPARLLSASSRAWQKQQWSVVDGGVSSCVKGIEGAKGSFGEDGPDGQGRKGTLQLALAQHVPTLPLHTPRQDLALPPLLSSFSSLLLSPPSPGAAPRRPGSWGFPLFSCPSVAAGEGPLNDGPCGPSLTHSTHSAQLFWRLGS